MTTETILAALLSLIIGGVIAYVISMGKVKNLTAESEKESENIIKKAKERANEIKKSAKFDSKQIIQEEKQELEKEYKKKVSALHDQERGLTKKEVSLDGKIEQKERELEALKVKESKIENEVKQTLVEREKYIARQSEISDKLTSVAGMSKEEAKRELMGAMEEEAKVDAAKMIARVEEEAQEESEKRGKRILGIALQRFAGEFVAEQSISSVELPGDEIKGRLIGREGRNIRAFEQICGVDLIIDDIVEPVQKQKLPKGYLQFYHLHFRLLDLRLFPYNQNHRL